MGMGASFSLTYSECRVERP